MTPEQLGALFAKLDTDGNGFIEASDYRRVLQAWVTDQDIRDRILKMDLDLDGRISFDEFAEHLQSSSGEPIGSPMDGFKRSDGTLDWFQVFLHFDTDGSGVLSLVELKAFVDELDGEATRTELLELIRSMDENGDLQVSYSEFRAYFEGGPARRRLRESV